ncbi:MAG: recombinase family protein [Bacilli bacterium]|jgi:DNA invertase Pin-like site-specific DNA recombinase/uncharacterized Zn-finger protein|nr:recombinase family protein [Bacilli bacterium]
MRVRKKKVFYDDNRPVKKCVLYLRYSSEGQREESIEGQRRENTNFCKRSGIEIVGEYIDRAKSATTDNRPEFQRMVRESESGLFDAVVVWRFDRFSRSRKDSVVYKEILRDNGVRVVSATEKSLDGPDSIIFDGLVDSLSEWYSADLSQKVKRGLTENVLEGKSIGATPPLGYTIVDHYYKIDEHEAPIVKEAFRLYVDENKSLLSIAKGFQKAGVKRTSGNEITHVMLEQAVGNDRYIGMLRCTGAENPNGFPRIIDGETFKKAQAKRERRKHSGGAFKADVEYALSKKVFCGGCGKPWIGQSGTSKVGRLYSYYKCNGVLHHEGCTMKPIPKDVLEKAVCETVLRVVGNSTIADVVSENLYKTQGTDSPELTAAKERLADVEKQRNNFAIAIGQGIITGTTKENLLRLEGEKERLENSIANEKTAEKNYTKRQIVTAMRLIAGSELDKDISRKVVAEKFVEKVIVRTNNTVTINANIFGAKISKDIPIPKGSLKSVRIAQAMSCQNRNMAVSHPRSGFYFVKKQLF